jgi:ATP-dependent DNA helicase RecQ
MVPGIPMTDDDPQVARDPLRAALLDRFGLDDFRPWQREAIDALLDGGQALVVAPTGGGKSLTYQFTATCLPGVTLVISPLVALMEDQVRSLDQRGVSATYLASTLQPDVRRARISGMLSGRYKLVYLAPERLQFDGFVDACARAKISLLAVDEAHCISMWGHDFRPDYLRIGDLIERLRPPRLMACTATATPDVRNEILARLRFDRDRVKVVLRGFARPNLHLAARSVDGPTESKETVRRELRRVLGEPARPKGGAIVYAATRKNTEQFADDLRHAGWNAAPYHAGLGAEERSNLSERFSDRKIDVVVATNAFGMGIDRADIRTVLHLQPPSSIESYYQEVGRAGRDGAEAHGLLLCSGMDIALRRRLTQMGTDGQLPEPAQAARAWSLFCELLRYLDAGTCRHDFMLRYFGDEREILGGCGHCDVCANIDQREDDVPQSQVDTVVRMGLSGVARARQRGGLQAIAEMLRGASSQRTQRFGFDQLSTFGLLRDRSQPWVLGLLRGFLAAGWIDLSPTEHPVPFVTASGAAVMRGTDPVRFRLPPDRERTRATPARRSAPEAAVASYDPALYERLRAWRAEEAKRRGLPAYVVAFDRTLQEVAARRPGDLSSLSQVHGLGPARVEAYGEILLKMLRASPAS